MGFLDDARGFLSNVLGTKVMRGGRNQPYQEYTQGGLFNRQPSQDYVSPLPKRPMEPRPSPRPQFHTQSEYAARPISDQAPQQQDPYEFPVGDKPAIPQEYREQLSQFPNANVIASVLAQESGGYNYLPYDYEGGQILDSWDEAKQRKLIGPSGEVGMAQIIPKWYWKEAGFPNEESYTEQLYDPNFSMKEASRILNRHFKIYGGDWKKVLSRWNKNPSYPDEILGRIGMLDQE